MKLPDSAHTSQPWRIHELTPDFDLVDVWALPTPGDRDDFRFLVEGAAAIDPSESSSLIVRLLFEARSRLGTVLGWDRPGTGLGSRVQSLRDRLPDDLRAAAPAPKFEATPFDALYLLDDEFAAEAANQTMHGVLHLGWVPDDQNDGYRGQLAVLVKPNGFLGSAYMAGITPFRHVWVYPTLMRDIGRMWNEVRLEKAGLS